MRLSDTQLEILKNIQSKLKRGDIRAISKTTGFSRDYVSLVLSPESEYYNESIVTEAVQMISDREQSTKKLLETITAA